MSFNRRDFLKITALTGALAGLSATAARVFLNKQEISKISATHYLMGTIINFVLLSESEEHAQSAMQASLDEMRRLIMIYDYRQANTPLGQLNAQGYLKQAPTELIGTIRQSLELGARSNGAFDITVNPILEKRKGNGLVTQSTLELVDYRMVNISGENIHLANPGMSITLDGVAKGSIIDAGVRILHKSGFENVLVEAGGDMMAKSTPAGETWQIGINHPRKKGELIAKISIHNQAVATSGDYLNYYMLDYSENHIIDPRSGRSPAQLASATALAPSAAEADALSTTLMVLGVRDGLALIEQLPGTAALMVSKDLKVYKSNNFPMG